jgi:hypothetical protein
MPSTRNLIAVMVLASASAMTVAFAAPQDCPTAQSAAMGFVVERGEKSKTEVFHIGDTDIRTVLRFDGTTLLETTQFQGLFDLERIDRGRRTVFRPTTDLSKAYPPNVGQSFTARFEATESERRSQLIVALTVRKLDQLDVGPCRYQVFLIDRSTIRDNNAARFTETDYYSPDLKLTLAKEFKETGGRTSFNKFDKVYLLKR